MDVPIIALMGLVAGGMTVHAAWAGDYLCRLSKECSGARGAIGDCGECTRRSQFKTLLGDRLVDEHLS
jgi:hypothetical protein